MVKHEDEGLPLSPILTLLRFRGIGTKERQRYTPRVRIFIAGVHTYLVLASFRVIHTRCTSSILGRGGQVGSEFSSAIVEIHVTVLPDLIHVFALSGVLKEDNLMVWAKGRRNVKNVPERYRHRHRG